MADSTLQTHIKNRFEGEFLTTAEAAELVGRSPATIRRYRKDGLLVPAKSEALGDIIVYLYSKEDVQKLRTVVARQRPGPKRKGWVAGDPVTPISKRRGRQRGMRTRDNEEDVADGTDPST